MIIYPVRVLAHLPPPHPPKPPPHSKKPDAVHAGGGCYGDSKEDEENRVDGCSIVAECLQESMIIGGGASLPGQSKKKDFAPKQKIKEGGGGPSGSAVSGTGLFPLRVNYCPANPCITMRVHDLHRQVLEGVEGAEIQLNRYLAVCALLNRDVEEEEKEDGDGSMQNISDRDDTEDAWNERENKRRCKEDGAGAPEKSSLGGAGTAHIIFDCMCGDPAHAVRMRKPCYMQQFKLWRRSSYVQKRGIETIGSRQAYSPLHVPLASLIPPVHAAFQHGLLPDLGFHMRMVLQRRYFSEQTRKHWTRGACNYQILGGYVPAKEGAQSVHGGGANHAGVPNTPANPSEAASQIAHRTWGHVNGLCTTLLHESMPCLKRSKRISQSVTHHDSKKTTSSSIHSGAFRGVEVSACINVLFGTLLKLYSPGVKVPTFRSRVSMTSRLMEISSLPTNEQVGWLNCTDAHAVLAWHGLMHRLVG